MTKLRSGIDLVKVSRLAKAYENFGLRFLHRIYDNLEIEQFKKKSTRAKPFFLAKNFALPIFLIPSKFTPFMTKDDFTSILVRPNWECEKLEQDDIMLKRISQKKLKTTTFLQIAAGASKAHLQQAVNRQPGYRPDD